MFLSNLRESLLEGQILTIHLYLPTTQVYVLKSQNQQLSSVCHQGSVVGFNQKMLPIRIGSYFKYFRTFYVFVVMRCKGKSEKFTVNRNWAQGPWLELHVFWPLSYDHWPTTSPHITLSIYWTGSSKFSYHTPGSQPLSMCCQTLLKPFFISKETMLSLSQNILVQLEIKSLLIFCYKKEKKVKCQNSLLESNPGTWFELPVYWPLLYVRPPGNHQPSQSSLYYRWCCIIQSCTWMSLS